MSRTPDQKRVDVPLSTRRGFFLIRQFSQDFSSIIKLIVEIKIRKKRLNNGPTIVCDRCVN